MADHKRHKRKNPKTYENKLNSGPDYVPAKFRKTADGEKSAAFSATPEQVHGQATAVPEVEKAQASVPRKWTVSVAIPGTLLDNAHTLELKTALAGQLARAFAVFNVDEVIIYNEKSKSSSMAAVAGGEGEEAGFRKDSYMFLARLLQYMETPQYLRKALIPMHKDLKFAGLLNPLDCPHHVRIDQVVRYREGVVLAKPARGGRAWANVGLRKEIQVDRALRPGVRVTVEMPHENEAKEAVGKVVSPRTPREVDGTYWGYQVRLAASFSRVLTEAPFENGYNLTIGISHRGQDIHSEGAQLPEFSHLLVAFGAPSGGLESAVDADEDLKCAGEDAAELFDRFVDPCPRAGSKTIRTEEAIFLAMTALGSQIWRMGR